MWSTYPVYSGKVSGTGFVMAVKAPHARGGFVPVVMTATHLLGTTGRDGVRMPVRVVDADGILIVSTTGPAASKDANAWYVRHPDHDLAVFELPFPEDLPERFLMTLIEEKNLEAGRRPRAGDRVVFAGYPRGRFVSDAAFPILRDGMVASHEQDLFESPVFLINGDVFPGDSGAPVARVARRGGMFVTGVVIQRLDDGDGESLPLAVAVDASAIRDTLRLFEDKMGEEPGIETSRPAP